MSLPPPQQQRGRIAETISRLRRGDDGAGEEASTTTPQRLHRTLAIRNDSAHAALLSLTGEDKSIISITPSTALLVHAGEYGRFEIVYHPSPGRPPLRLVLRNKNNNNNHGMQTVIYLT